MHRLIPNKILYHCCLCVIFQRLQTFTGALDSSVSGDDLQSDLGDPLHDESLLQDLFYKYVSILSCTICYSAIHICIRFLDFLFI